MIPAEVRGGSAMIPVAPYQRHTTGAMRSSSPGSHTRVLDRAKMSAVPTAVPTAVPAVIGPGTPVLVSRVPAVPAVSGTVPRTASPDRRQYF